MPRAKRQIPADSVVHALNRGNDRKGLFHQPLDYEEFLGLIAWAKDRCPMRIVAYCLMPNHWHAVLWPESASATSAFFHRLCTAHASRRRWVTRSVGEGHIYQDRFHAFAIRSERQYYQVLRYVEANPVRAGLVQRAEHWKWSSLHERTGEDRGLLSAGPLALPEGWIELVNQRLPDAFLMETRERFRRARMESSQKRERQNAETAANSM